MKVTRFAIALLAVAAFFSGCGTTPGGFPKIDVTWMTVPFFKVKVVDSGSPRVMIYTKNSTKEQRTGAGATKHPTDNETYYEVKIPSSVLGSCTFIRNGKVPDYVRRHWMVALRSVQPENEYTPARGVVQNQKVGQSRKAYIDLDGFVIAKPLDVKPYTKDSRKLAYQPKN